MPAFGPAKIDEFLHSKICTFKPYPPQNSPPKAPSFSSINSGGNLRNRSSTESSERQHWLQTRIGAHAEQGPHASFRSNLLKYSSLLFVSHIAPASRSLIEIPNVFPARMESSGTVDPSQNPRTPPRQGSENDFHFQCPMRSSSDRLFQRHRQDRIASRRHCAMDVCRAEATTWLPPIQQPVASMRPRL